VALSVDLDLLRGLHRRGIPPAPSTAIRQALALAGDESASNDLLIEHIEVSPQLRLGFMAGANLPMFCDGRPIRTVHQGVSVLGRRKALSLFWLLALADFLQSAKRRAIGMDWQFGALSRLWRHSLLTGVLAWQLVRAAGCDFQEDALTAGLGHDIGHLLLVHAEPRFAIASEEEEPVLNRLHEHDNSPILELNTKYQTQNTKVLEHDMTSAPDRLHCRLGASLLEFWNAPASLVSCALQHHDPQSVVIDQRPLIIGVRLADLLAEHLELDRPTPALRLEAAPVWQRLAATDPWNQVADLHRLALEQLPDALVTANHLARVLGE